MTFGEYLRKIRKERGLNGGELAQMVGVKEKTIWRYERDENDPTLGVLVSLADALNVSIDEMAGRVPPQASEPLELLEGHANGPTRIELLVGSRRFVWAST